MLTTATQTDSIINSIAKKIPINWKLNRVRRLAQPRIIRVRASATALSDYSELPTSSFSSVSDGTGISSTTEAARKRRIKGFRFEASCKNFTRNTKMNKQTKENDKLLLFAPTNQYAIHIFF